MSFNDYASFKTEVADWIAVGGLGETTTTGKVDTFIDLFESEWNATQRCRQMEAQTTIAMTTAGYLSHPSDWVAWKSLTIVVAGKRQKLDPLTPELAAMRGDQSGIVKGFEVVGDRTYLINPPSTQAVDAIYWQKVPALSASQTTNWLMNDYPGIYLTGVRRYAARWLRDQERINECEADYQMALGIVKTASDLASISGQVPRQQPDRVV